MALDGRITIAVVGEFQVGKSSLINCLLGRNAAKVGNGWKSETPVCIEHVLPNDVVLIDTPGVNDTLDRDKEADKAIQRADCVLFVKDNEKHPGDVYLSLAESAKRSRKPSIFICNCVVGERNLKKHWNPQSEFNVEYCRGVCEGFIGGKKGFDMFMPIEGRLVLPVNACWAQYGLGLLDDEDKIDDIERFLPVSEESDSEATRKAAALVLSNITILRNYVSGIRLELLHHCLTRKDNFVQCFADRFFEELGKHLVRGDVP